MVVHFSAKSMCRRHRCPNAILSTRAHYPAQCTQIKKNHPSKSEAARFNIEREMGRRVIAIAKEACSKTAVVLSLAGLCGLVSPGETLANEKIGEFGASGLIPVPGVFRDTIQVVELDDPEVSNVSIYFTDYNRSIQEKLGGDLFSDPSQSSISCVPLGKVAVRNAGKVRGSEGQEIFKESKALNLFQNKKTRIRRIYDEERNVIIYVAFSTRNTTSSDEGGVSSSRYRTSMCAVKVDSVSASD
eukprot:jgi/Picsp_1/1523/NSC_05001-R1_protein